MKRRLLAWLRVLTTPGCWIQLHPYVDGWDVKCRWLLDNGYRFYDVKAHTARIGDYTLWISNHPYASFHPYDDCSLNDLRPRRITILQLGDRLQDDAFPCFYAGDALAGHLHALPDVNRRLQ